ncbi:MAG: single-stranded-DNA-specific exonuclease RecJ, partial [Bacteroidetes bacterium]
MKEWKIKKTADKNKINELSNVLNIDKVLANLLIQRGIDTFDKAKKFFRSNLSDLHDPFLMKDMDVAVERLEKAIKNNEKVLIYGDYDVDGTTSVAIMFSFLKEYLPDIDFYVPDRYTEGYGISFKSVDYAIANKFDLVIALDCGIKANEKINLANKHNLDYIICDHHTPGETLPDAIAVLDPKRNDCNYPFKELSGAGVGFKLLQALTIKNSYDINKLFSLLDLVTISIASDIVPIIDENRILATYGLKIINNNPRTGIAAIIKTSGLANKNIIISDIVFKIGPRINAAGRIENAKDSVNVLISDDNDKAFEFAKIINEHNTNRQSLDKDITKQALELINNNSDLQNRKTTVLYDESWSKGVIGIVASRLIEHYYRPTIIFTKSNNLLTGSARSIAGFDLYEALEKCSDLFVNFGGHKYAAGLSIKPENFDKFLE